MTANVCAAVGAAAYWLFPAWFAAISQVPRASTVTMFPETVQIDGVMGAKLTGRPEDAVALKLNGAVPKVTAGSAAKLMV